VVLYVALGRWRKKEGGEDKDLSIVFADCPENTAIDENHFSS